MDFCDNSLKAFLHHPLTPPVFLIVSYESQNVSDHGAIRSQHGRKPLYKAEMEIN